MGDPLPIQDDLVIPDAELIETATTSGGPGGQHANKTASRVTLRWSIATSQVLDDGRRARLLEALANRINDVGEIVIQADDTRSWHQNRAIARERLAELVRRALVRRRRRRATRPTRASKERRIGAKKQRGAVKEARGRPKDE